jgi:hypothetical protein
LKPRTTRIQRQILKAINSTGINPKGQCSNVGGSKEPAGKLGQQKIAELPPRSSMPVQRITNDFVKCLCLGVLSSLSPARFSFTLSTVVIMTSMATAALPEHSLLKGVQTSRHLHIDMAAGQCDLSKSTVGCR